MKSSNKFTTMINHNRFGMNFSTACNYMNKVSRIKNSESANNKANGTQDKKTIEIHKQPN